MNLTCQYCKHAECHGYPPEGTTGYVCFTVYMMCSRTHKHVNPYDSCDEHQWGEPRIVRDDADGGF